MRLGRIFGLAAPVGIWSDRLRNGAWEPLNYEVGYQAGCFAPLLARPSRVEFEFEHNGVSYGSTSDGVLALNEGYCGLYASVDLDRIDPRSRDMAERLARVADDGLLLGFSVKVFRNQCELVEGRSWYGVKRECFLAVPALAEVSILVASPPAFSSCWAMRDGVDARDRFRYDERDPLRKHIGLSA